MTAFSVATMASLSLAGSGFAREAPIPPAQRGPEFDARFDSETLWYDAVRLGDHIHLVMPPLLNLAGLMNDASLTVGGQRVRMRRNRFRRHEIVRVKAPGDEVTFAAPRWTGTSAVSADGLALFEGLNASVHISRNNDLRWIADWARFHVSAHGLEAMLVMDNGSDAYPAEAILEALQPTGIKRAVVLKVPHPYGPPRTKAHPGTAKFLQPAMLNLARLRFLGRARAVLNVDIDELVWTTGPSIFDAAKGSPLGYVSFKGAWRVPDPTVTAPTHGDHVFLRRDQKPCPTKYCIVPGGMLRGWSWDVHRLERGLLLSRFMARNAGYWHCSAVTTNWKSHNRLKPKRPGPRDAETAEAMARHLPPLARGGPT